MFQKHRRTFILVIGLMIVVGLYIVTPNEYRVVHFKSGDSLLKIYLQLRDDYVYLMEQSVLNTIYEYKPQMEDGSIIHSGGLTMIGRVRLRNLRWALQTVIDDGIEGDVIETGVWKGGAMIFAAGVLKANNVVDRKVYLCDSFKGIPPVDTNRYPKDKVHSGHNISLTVSPEDVKTSFKRFGLWGDNIQIVQGWFNETLHKITGTFSIVRLDGDLYQSTWEALHALYPKLQYGGFIIVDDYPAWAGCVMAVDDFRAKYFIKDEINRLSFTGIYWRKTKKGGGEGFISLYT